MKVPFLDLTAQYLNIQEEIDEAIKQVLKSAAFAAGPFVQKFEEEFALAHEAPYCVGLNSGTAALHAALAVLNIGNGDEVIVPANTFMATPASVSLTGATPVFVDCDEKYSNIDVNLIEKAITPKTKAIIPVHLYGQPANMEQICDIAKKHNILVIEDCAQSHLAKYKETYTGNFGIMSCFSFYPGKNLGAYGEGGAVVTHNKELYNKLIAYRQHGMYEKYYHDFLGHNYRMEGIQGAVLSVKLSYLHKWTEIRRRNARLYNEQLANIPGITTPIENPDVCHAYHLYVIRTKNRTNLAQYLLEKDIQTSIHYPVPCHLQKAYSFLNHKLGDFPVSEMLATEILSLPMSEQLQAEQIKYVAEQIRLFQESEYYTTLKSVKKLSI